MSAVGLAFAAVGLVAVLAYAGLKSRVVRHFDASLASKTAGHDR